ncbi:MAG: hypothetical protein AAF411_22740 [Myxococcota bacterium]
MGLSQISLLRHLPFGGAWDRSPDGGFGRLFDAMGIELDRVESLLRDLRKSRDPRSGLYSRRAWEATGHVFGFGWDAESNASSFYDATEGGLSDDDFGTLAVANLRSAGPLTPKALQEAVDLFPPAWELELIEVTTPAPLEVVFAVDTPFIDALNYFALMVIQRTSSAINRTFDFVPIFESSPIVENFSVPGTPPVDSDELRLGSWSGSGGPAPTTTYQWTSNGADIPGATNQNYTAVGEAGNTVGGRITLTNSRGSRTATAPGVVIG